MSGPAGQQNSNLPAEMTSFVGRHRELSEVRRSLKSARLVTITGMGGVGKTRLALRAASELTRRFPDGTWLAELSAANRAGVLAYVVADVLGLRDQTARRRADVLAQQVAGKHLLLVLDTCEHLVDACAALAERLLRAAPHLRIVATSRQPFDISGEHVLVIEPLNAPRPETDTDLHSLRRNDAVTLFAERASAIVPGFAVNQHNSASVAALCRRLDGVPLALELAAVRLRALSVEQLLHQLDNGRRPLGVGRRGGIPRHRTMRAAVGWSHELCTPGERLAWARLSVFAGDFGLAAAEHVCAGPGIVAGTELSLVASLVDKSLLRVYRRGTEVRYRMLGAIREYGREWLSRLGEEVRLRRVHRDWCLALAHQGERDWFAGHQADVFRRTQAEHASLQAALEFCFATPGERQAGLELAATLWFYWVGCGRLGEGRYWLDRGLLGAAAVDRPGRAPHAAPGHTHLTSAPHASAPHSPHASSANASSANASSANASGPHATPERVTALGQPPPWAKALWVDGYISILQGDIVSAVSMLEACRDYAAATGDERVLANCVHGLGSAALIGGEPARAAALFGDALSRYDALGQLNSIVIMASVGLAMADVFQGDLDAAVRTCAQIQSACEASGERWACSHARYVTAFAAWARRDVAGALANAQECLRIDHTFHDLVGIALAIELIALLSAYEGDPSRAAVLLGAASRIWPSVGLPLFGSQYFNGPHDECVRRTREALTEREFAAAFDYGAGLPLDRAVVCALGRAALPAPVRSAAWRSGTSAPDDLDAPSQGAGPPRGARRTPESPGAAGSGPGSRDGGAGASATAGVSGPLGPDPATAPARTPAPWPPLSRRECQVAALVAEGLCNREIAHRLVIAKRTADAHVEHILAKLTFTSRTQVATWVTQRQEGADGDEADGARGEATVAQPLLRPQ